MIKTALRLFAAEGYENVGIQKIVKAVNVKPPTLYHYFGSKQGLLDALLSFYFDPFFEELEKIAVYKDSLNQVLEGIITAFFRFTQDAPDFYRFVLSLMYSSKQSEAWKTVHPFVKQVFAVLESVFHQAGKDYADLQGNSRRNAATFQGMINLYITTFFYGHTQLDEEDAHIACQHYLYGIIK